MNPKLWNKTAPLGRIEDYDKVLPVLENAFHRSGQTLWAMLKIVNIIVKIGGPEAHKLLWQKSFPKDKILIYRCCGIYLRES